MNATETIKRLLGWCPNANQNRKITLYRHVEIPEVDFGSKPPSFRPILLKNAYVMGITREAVIGISLALIFIILAIGRFSPFFESELLYLIMLSVMLLQLTLSRTSVEIGDRHIRLKTVFTPLLGSTDRDIASVDSVEVRKNKTSQPVYGLLFMLGILWLFRFFLDITEGVSMEILAQSMTWALVSFGFGHQLYSASKSMFNIRIRFTPCPSINKISINSKDAGQIADLINKVRNRNPGD